MRGTCVLAAVQIVLAALAVSSQAHAAQQVALPIRDYRIDTIIADDGNAQAVIVTSSRAPGYAALAQSVQARVHKLAGVTLPILDAEKVEPRSVLDGVNAIVLGNLVTSRFVETLYWEWYTLLDLWYPGPGGYVVRTLHDPYGTGRNVILLGGSDDEGVAKAAEMFNGLLGKGNPLKVGRLMHIVLGPNHNVPAAGKWIDPRLRIFLFDNGSPLGYTAASRAGLIYHYNGDEEMANRFRRLALETPILTHSDHYTSHMHAIVWDLIEESPVFSNADRAAITERLLVHARGTDGTQRRQTLLNYDEDRALLERHTSMAAVCMLTSSRYFGKYYPAKEWADNLAAVRKYFDRQMVTGKADSDLGGRGIYTYLECALIPALLLRDERFVESGALRDFAELVLMHCDNVGYMPDTGQSDYLTYPIATLGKCAALLREPGLLATMPRRWETERLDGYNAATREFTAGQSWTLGLAPEPMKKMVGIYHLPLTQWEWEVRGKDVPIEKTFDKLTMRGGFGRDDQYLLLDGLHGGPPGKPWPDVNSIASFCQNGRIFLVSSAGGENPVNHNVVTVSKEGFGEVAGNVAALETTADLPGHGYVHSRAPRHMFSTWDRHIFWRKGSWFVVLDCIEVREPGRYSMECQWRTIGKPVMTGNAFSAAVSDGIGAPADTLHIKNAENLPLRFSELKRGLFGPPENVRWRRYYARQTINRVRQMASRTMAAGDTQVFTNLLYVQAQNTPGDYEITKLDDRRVLVTGSETAVAGVLAGQQLRQGTLSVNGDAFCATPESLMAAGATTLHCGPVKVIASVPCGMLLEPAKGGLTVELQAAGAVSVNDKEHRLESGLHVLTASAIPEWPRVFEQLTRQEIAPPPESAPDTDSYGEMEVAWEQRLGSPVTALHTVQSDTPYPFILAGLEDGRTTCLGVTGKRSWTHKAGDAVRALADTPFNDSVAALAGSGDEQVYALRLTDGSLFWRHRCTVPEDRFRAYPWWTMGGKAKVQAILPADLDGDGDVEIICGTGGGCIETLHLNGTEKWVSEMRWGIPDRFQVAPVPDGTRTLLAGNSWSSCGSTTWRYAADGKLMSANAFPTGRGSWDMTAVPVLETVRFGDGPLMAVVGRNGAFNELSVYDAATGGHKWTHAMADAVTSVAFCNVQGDPRKEIVVGSPSGWLTAFGADGTLIWAVQMPHEIRGVTVAPSGEGFITTCADAKLYRVDFVGDIKAAYALNGFPSASTQVLDDLIVAGDETGRVTALRP